MGKIVWNVRWLGKLLSLHVPGGALIEIHDFDLSKVKVTEYSAEEFGQKNGLFEDWRYRFWQYEISPGVLLFLGTSWDAKQPGSERHYLEINHQAWCTKWDVPESFAEELLKLGK